MDVDADGPKLPISLNDVIGLNFMSPIESMDWAGDRFVVIKYSDSVEMLDLDEDPPKNITLVNAEALVSHPEISFIINLVSLWKGPLDQRLRR